MKQEREITYEDLLDDEDPADTALPRTMQELHADGFPRRGGLETLAAIIRMAEAVAPGSAARREFREILERQAAPARRRA